MEHKDPIVVGAGRNVEGEPLTKKKVTVEMQFERNFKEANSRGLFALNKVESADEKPEKEYDKTKTVWFVGLDLSIREPLGMIWRAGLRTRLCVLRLKIFKEMRL